MTDRELMQQALEWADKHGEIVFAGGGWDAVNAMNAWAKAARKRLAQPEQEPVAWFSPSGNLYKTRFHATANGEQVVTPLYTTPPQRTDQKPHTA